MPERSSRRLPRYALRRTRRRCTALTHGKVEPQEKKKTPKGRAKKRLTYTRRFVNVTLTGGKRKVGTHAAAAQTRILTSADEPQPRNLDDRANITFVTSNIERHVER